jgi:hypothetical protein
MRKLHRLLASAGALSAILVVASIGPAQALEQVGYSPIVYVRETVNSDVKLQSKASVNYTAAGNISYYGVAYRIQDCSACWSYVSITKAYVDVWLYRNGVATYTSTRCDVTADAAKNPIESTKTWPCSAPQVPRKAGATYQTRTGFHIVYSSGHEYVATAWSPVIRVP